MPVPNRYHGQTIEFGDAMPRNCSSALFGGQYYPGKDKRRYRGVGGGGIIGGRRSLFYRVCCSSTPRIICFTLLWGYILICFILIPLGRGMYHLGVRLLTPATIDNGNGKNDNEKHFRPANHITAGSHHSYGRNGVPPSQQQQMPHHKYKLNGDLTQLPTLEWERQREIDRRNHWDLHGKIPGQHSKEKIDLLSRSVPEWAHRNEIRNDDGDTSEQHHPTEHENEDANAEDDGMQNGDKVVDLDAQDHSQNDEHDNNDVEDATSIVEDGMEDSKGSTIRTLQTMETDGSCPPMEEAPTVSLVIQSSLDRLWLVRETCHRWSSPIVLVIYYDPLSQGLDEPPPWSDLVTSCQHIQIVPYPHSTTNAESWQYPINQLRNAGLAALETSHFLVLDVDFIPSSNLHDVVIQNLSTLVGLHLDDGGAKQALVVPAFDRKNSECSTVEECQQKLQLDPKFIPSSFDEVRQCAKSKTKDCIVFQSDNNWDGHSSTKTKFWLDKNWYDDQETGSKQIPRTIPCFDSFRYEPYVVLRWCPGMTPFYDERFFGYGKNKIEYISHLRFLGYSFSVLPEGFIVHHPHPQSHAKTSWLSNENELHENMDELYPQFLSELFELHGTPKLGQCPRPKKRAQKPRPQQK